MKYPDLWWLKKLSTEARLNQKELKKIIESYGEWYKQGGRAYANKKYRVWLFETGRLSIENIQRVTVEFRKIDHLMALDAIVRRDYRQKEIAQ
jgi:hypothetical protein